MTAWLPQRQAPLVTAGVFTVLLAVGSVFEAELPTALMNRTIGLGLLWAMAVLLYRYKQQLSVRLEAEATKRQVLEDQLRVSEASLASARQRAAAGRHRDRVRRQHDRYLLQRSRDLESVCRISEGLLQQTSEDTLLQDTLQALVVLVGAEAGCILLFDHNRTMLIVRAVTGPRTEGLRGEALASRSGIAGAMLTLGLSEVVSEGPHDRRQPSSLDVVGSVEAGSVLALPLQIAGEEPIGAIELINKRTGPFDQTDLDAARAIATLLTATLEQLRISAGQRTRPTSNGPFVSAAC